MAEQYAPMVVKAARVEVHLEGQGTWSGSKASFGWTVTAYPRADWPTPDNGLVTLGANLCNPISETGTVAAASLNVHRGFRSATSVATWTDQHQDYLARHLAELLDGLYTGLAKTYRITELRIRPFGIVAPPDGPDCVYSLPSTIYTPTVATRWQPAAGATPTLTAFKVKHNSMRRGHRWTGRMHWGPLYQNIIDSSTGLLTSTTATNYAGYFASVLQKWRTSTLYGTQPTRTMPIVWPKGWETASPIVSVSVQDELGDMPIRQRHRVGAWYTSASLT